MNTERLVEALSEYQLNPTEIADILWLALRQPREMAEPKASQSAGAGWQIEGPSNQESNDSSTESREKDATEIQDNEGRDKEPSFDITVLSGTLPPKALPISLPDAGFLGETLPLVRALKPLLKQIESTTASHVNEAATVERIAETNIWSPVMRIEHEPWFEVALVIDGSASMGLWKRLIQDIQDLLRCYGSFRDLRIWELARSNGNIGVRTMPDRSIRSPKAILSPNSRRLVLVFSDCTADYWWDGKMQPVLVLWGNTMPTVIWQVLPDWMWKRTALGAGEYVAIRNRIPGATNRKLQPTFLSLRPLKRLQEHPANNRLSTQEASSESSVCVPVITTDGLSIAAWSRMLAGDCRQSAPGFVLPSRGWERFHDRRSTIEPDERLEQFRLRATPAARRLAALLSAAPVLTLPIMRLIRAAMLPESSLLPVVEVFLSGLLQRSADQPDIIDLELVQYSFPNETRDRLLDILPPVETIAVIEAVSQHVAERLNCTLADFRALLLSPDLRVEAEQYGLKAFAQVTAQILRKLGRDYAALAAQFESPRAPTGLKTEDWPDFPLEEFEYEVAQLLNFPPIQTCEYESATITYGTAVELQVIPHKTQTGLSYQHLHVSINTPTGIITPEALKTLKIPDTLNKGQGVVIEGKAPIWLYGCLIHACHTAAWIACFDPRLGNDDQSHSGGAVVVATHTPQIAEGEVLIVTIPDAVP